MATENNLSLLELPDVIVSSVVSVFTGKLLGKISRSSCSFSKSCPIMEENCKTRLKKHRKKRYAVLTPDYPSSSVSEKNLKKCFCKFFDPDLVSFPN